MVVVHNGEESLLTRVTGPHLVHQITQVQRVMVTNIRCKWKSY